MKNDAKIWKGINLSVQYWHKEFNKIWLEHSKISQTYTLMGCFWPKYIMFEFRKYRGVMFNGTQDWNIVWRKNDLLPKITLRIWQIFTRAALENFKIGIFMVSFCLKLKMHKFKNCTGVCVMKMRNDAKIEEELTFQFKIDKRNLTNIDPSTWKYQKFAL